MFTSRVYIPCRDWFIAQTYHKHTTKRVINQQYNYCTLRGTKTGYITFLWAPLGALVQGYWLLFVERKDCLPCLSDLISAVSPRGQLSIELRGQFFAQYPRRGAYLFAICSLYARNHFYRGVNYSEKRRTGFRIFWIFFGFFFGFFGIFWDFFRIFSRKVYGIFFQII